MAKKNLMDYPEAMYEDVRDRLDTGDVVLYSGNGPASLGIRVGSKSKWSHVGMVVRSKELDTVLVYQSTTLSKIKDWELGLPRQGVQINALSHSIESYRGDVSIRRLGGFDRSPEMMKVLSDFRTEMKGRPYEKSKVELFRAAYDGPGGHNNEDLTSLFCSELIAELFQRWGLLDEVCNGGWSSNEYIPKDFAQMSTRKGISLRCGAYLGNETPILKRAQVAA